MTNLIGLDTEQIRIDMRVEVQFEALAGGITLPYFRPVAGG
jgi:hypothetical protein